MEATAKAAVGVAVIATTRAELEAPFFPDVYTIHAKVADFIIWREKSQLFAEKPQVTDASA